MDNNKAVNLAISTLMECVESEKSMEICILTEGNVTTYMGEEVTKRSSIFTFIKILFYTHLLTVMTTFISQ